MNSYYTGFTTTSVLERLHKHNDNYYNNKYTAKTSDWEIYLSIECTSEKQARAIESHIKKMKSKKYIINLKLSPNIVQDLFNRYSTN